MAEELPEAAAALAPPRRIARHHVNTVLYFAVSLLSKAVSLFLIPLYTSRLSREEYAVYGLCQTLYWVGPPLGTLALSSALARFFFDERDPERRDRTVGRIATAIIVLALGFALAAEIVFAIAPFLRIGILDVRTLRFVVWTCSALAMAEIPMIYYRASEQAGRYVTVNLSIFAFTALSTVYFMVVRKLGLTGMLAGMLIGQGSGALYALVFTFKSLHPSLGRDVLVEAARYSIPFIPHMIGTSLMVGVDRWALEYYDLRGDLGLYTLATQLTVPVQMAATAWNEASSPRFLAAWRDGGDPAARAALPRIVLGFVATTGVALLAIFIGIPILKHLVGSKFQAAFPLVPWIGMSLVVGTLFSAFINVLFLRKTTRIIPALTLTSVGVNVALNFLFVPHYGVYGAIGATALAFAFRSGLMLAFAMRALRQQPVAS
jgi:O-antigen/teichoic acid export membrane protein